jgi:outer membrane protein assembly factor BamB
MGPVRTTEQSVSIYDATKAYGGYTLFAPHYGKDVWLIDMKGRVVHRWQMNHLPGGDGRLLPNGNLLRLNKTMKEPLLFFGSVSGELVEIDWDGNIVWKHEDPYMHHDFFRMDNGNTMLNRHVLLPEDRAARVKGGILGTELEGGMWGNAFREITPDGKVVWEWLGYEHMDPAIDIPCPLCPRTIWGYINSLFILPEGDIVASFRHLNTIAIIDKRTGAITWRWGAPYELGHQHNPTVLPNGNILVFDNGYHRRTSSEIAMIDYSRVVEVDPKTGDIEWEYKDENVQNFYSGICSSAERLPNGNTLICESAKGRIFEVTPDKEIVWEFMSPFHYPWERMGMTNLIFKAHRYGYAYEGLQGKVLDPDRFEWLLREKGKSITEEKEDIKEKARRRLKRLGY